MSRSFTLLIAILRSLAFVHRNLLAEIALGASYGVALITKPELSCATVDSKQCILEFISIRPDQRTVTVVVQYLSFSISVANLLLL